MHVLSYYVAWKRASCSAEWPWGLVAVLPRHAHLRACGHMDQPANGAGMRVQHLLHQDSFQSNSHAKLPSRGPELCSQLANRLSLSSLVSRFLPLGGWFDGRRLCVCSLAHAAACLDLRGSVVGLIRLILPPANCFLVHFVLSPPAPVSVVQGPATPAVCWSHHEPTGSCTACGLLPAHLPAACSCQERGCSYTHTTPQQTPCACVH